MGFDNWVRVEAFGFSGGIWVLWRNGFNVEICKTHPQFIRMEVSVNEQPSWLLSIVYGSPTPSLRQFLWHDLNRNHMNLSLPNWLAVGDFKYSIFSVEEVSNEGG